MGRNPALFYCVMSGHLSYLSIVLLKKCYVDAHVFYCVEVGIGQISYRTIFEWNLHSLFLIADCVDFSVFLTESGTKRP